MKKALSRSRRAQLWTGFSAVCCAALFILTTRAPGAVSHAQFCNPAVVDYLVHDEQGKLLTAAALTSVAVELPTPNGGARLDTGEVSLVAGGQRFYSAEAADWARGAKVPALQFSNSERCAMQMGTVTLTYNGQRMRLVFKLDITRAQPQRLRRWVIDSLPFQAGTFALEVDGWPRAENEVIPAERWRAVPGQTP